jgi:hypothetical protein
VRTYAKVQTRASLYEKSSEVTSGHKVARRIILVMMVLAEALLAKMLRLFAWITGSLTNHLYRTQ